MLYEMFTLIKIHTFVENWCVSIIKVSYKFPDTSTWGQLFLTLLILHKISMRGEISSYSYRWITQKNKVTNYYRQHTDDSP